MVGTNGIGKSTALNVLAGRLKPNLGRFNVVFYLLTLKFSCFLVNAMLISLYELLLQNPPDWSEILAHFQGSELQDYFNRIVEGKLKVCFEQISCSDVQFYC